MQKLISLIILLTLSAAGCKQSTEPQPVNDKPPGYQEDIPWPSLADSPWPAWHHDMQSTGRTNVAGPVRINSVNYINVGIMYSDVVVDESGTLYFQSGLPSRLIAMTLEGNIFWEKDNGNEPSTAPTIISGNKLVVATDTYNTYCLNEDSTINWIYSNKSENYSKAISVDKNGNLYFVENDRSLIVLSKDGQLLWKISDNDILTGSDQFITFSPDGNTAYLMGSSVAVIAVDVTTHKTLWKYGFKGIKNTPLITSEGNIVLLEKMSSSEIGLTVLNSHGVIIWQYSFQGHYLNDIEPTIDYEGNIYFGTDTLYSVNIKGELNWKTSLGTEVSRYTAIVCDKNNNIYFGAYTGNEENLLFSYSSKGEKNWDVTIENESFIGNPIIAAEGTLVIPTFNSNSLIILR